MVCSSPPCNRVLLGALRVFECGSACLEAGEFSPGKNCVEPNDATQAEQSKAGAEGRMEAPVPRATPKKVQGRKQAGVPEVPKGVRRKRGA